jgi:hypothetical protein
MIGRDNLRMNTCNEKCHRATNSEVVSVNVCEISSGPDFGIERLHNPCPIS